MITMPNELKANKEYLMQIVDTSSEYQDCGAFARDKIEFIIRIWPNEDKLEHFYDVTEVFYNNGRCAKYLVEFVETVTEDEFCVFDPDVEYAVGATFYGVITIKKKADYWGNSIAFYNIAVIEALGYYDVEGGDEA